MSAANVPAHLCCTSPVRPPGAVGFSITTFSSACRNCSLTELNRTEWLPVGAEWLPSGGRCNRGKLTRNTVVHGASITRYRHLLLPEGWPDPCHEETSRSTPAPLSSQANPSFAPGRSAPNASIARRLGLSVLGASGQWLVAPTKRFMVCTMEKNGMSEWIRLMRATTGRVDRRCTDTACAFNGLLDDIHECQLPSVRAFAAEQLTAMLYCRSIIKAVVVRDPLERLLSGYLDKCAFSHRAEGREEAMPLISHCQGFYAKELKESVSANSTLTTRNRAPREIMRVPRFADFVARLHRTQKQSLGWDTHFKPQHMHCGLASRRADVPSLLPSVHHHLRMSGSHFHASADALFRHVGLNTALRREFLPERSNSAHRTAASEQMARYYTPSIAQQALEIYAADYDAFGLVKPRPETFASSR